VEVLYLPVGVERDKDVLGPEMIVGGPPLNVGERDVGRGGLEGVGQFAGQHVVHTDLAILAGTGDVLIEIVELRGEDFGVWVADHELLGHLDVGAWHVHDSRLITS